MPPAKLAYRSPCKSHLLSIMEFNCNCKASTARFWSSSVREDNVWSSVSTGGGSKSPGGSESSSLSSSSLSLPSSSPAFSSSRHWCPGEKGPSQFGQFSPLLWRGRGEPIRDLEDSPLDSPWNQPILDEESWLKMSNWMWCEVPSGITISQSHPRDKTLFSGDTRFRRNRWTEYEISYLFND